MIELITIYPVRTFVAYKQNPDFLRYLARRDGFISTESEAHYYIVHTDKNLRHKPPETIDFGLVRHFIYVPRLLFACASFAGWLSAFKKSRTNRTRERILVINNTFHQIIIHLLARLSGWRSLKIMGTFFYHARRGWKKHIVDALEWMHCFFASRIIVLSPSGWEFVPKRFHVKTIYTIPNFLYDAPPRTGESAKAPIPFSAVCLSRLEPEKGLKGLIEAWQQTDPSWYLTIYGDGSQKNELEERIRALGLSGRVAIGEPLSHAHVFGTLVRYSVFILTSPCEGLGIAYLEALYMNVPCIGLRVPGVKDTLGDGRGILLEPTDWRRDLNKNLGDAAMLRTNPEWQKAVDMYFTNAVIPHITTDAARWFDAQNKTPQA